MIQRPHGVESVSGVAGAGANSGAGGIQRGVGVADADTDFAPRRFCYYLECSGKLRRDGYHGDVAARRLPEAFKHLQCRLDEVLRGMNTTPLVTEKWTFQMNTQRPCLHRAAVTGGRMLIRFDGVGQAL